MSTPMGDCKASQGKAADAAAAASLAEKPRPLPLPPGVSFESLRGRLKKSTAAPALWGNDGHKNDRSDASVSARIEALNKRIQGNTDEAAKTELDAVRFKVRFAPRAAKSEDAQVDSKREVSVTGSAVATGLNCSAKPSEDERAVRGDDPNNDSADREDAQGVAVETIPIASRVSDDSISPAAEAAEVDQAWIPSEILPSAYTEASLLQLCRWDPPMDAKEQSEPSEEALVDKILTLLPDPDSFEEEIDELFAACTAQSGNATLSSQELYDLTQRLIDLFGSRDKDVLERISLIYTSMEETCGPDSGIGVVQLRGYVASVLTQILHELESRGRPSPTLDVCQQKMRYVPSPSATSSFVCPSAASSFMTIMGDSFIEPPGSSPSREPTGGLEPEFRQLWQPEPGNAASPGLADVFTTWLPGRQKSEQTAEIGGGAIDLVRNSWASLRGSMANLMMTPRGHESQDASDHTNAAVQSCVARGTVETAQDISPRSFDAAHATQGARGKSEHESPG